MAKRCLLSLVAIGLSLAAPGADAAGPAEASTAGAQVVVLPMRVEGEVSDVARVRISEAMNEGLSAAGLQVVVADEATSSKYASCNDVTCLQGAHESLGADYIAWLELGASGRDYDVTLRVHATTGSETQTQTTCEICGFDEVADTVRTQANGIAAKLERLDAPGVLVITSEPSGAEILVDGVVVGETPLTYELAAGKHKLAIRKSGYATREQSIEVSGGAEERMMMALNEVREDEGSSRGLKIAGWSLVGVGAAGVGAGAALLAIHHDPASGRCDDPANIDVNGLCRWRYTTRTPGIIGLAAGGAALLGGVGLLVVDAKRRRAKSGGSDDVGVRVDVGWGRVSLGGRF